MWFPWLPGALEVNGIYGSCIAARTSFHQYLARRACRKMHAWPGSSGRLGRGFPSMTRIARQHRTGWGAAGR